MTTFGADALGQEVEDVLQALDQGASAGRPLGELLESKRVDLKEEAGRRSALGLAPSAPHSEPAAAHLAEEAACMANTDGGGALIVGVANDGTVIGTDLDIEWLRRRIYDLTDRALTCDGSERFIRSQRVLVLRIPEAVEPVRFRGRIKWRVDDSCVEVDASAWRDRRDRRIGFDWSALSSGLPATAARASALERARDFLRASQEEHALELAEASDADLLSRLNAVLADGTLTNAGAVAFVGRAVPALDYIRRQVAGGDSTNRLRQPRRGLVEELYDVEQAIRSANPISHLARGLVSGQVRRLPDGAVRETIVNGCVHRDWHTDSATVVEHEGDRLVVTSPGGFVGGVTASNIITYPSQPRNRLLAELFAALRVAEREGIGVDRMVREMVRYGHPAPVIEQIEGPRVRAVLVGDLIDEGWVGFVRRVRPASHASDLNSLLLLRLLVDNRWVDQALAAPVLQRSPVETDAALHALARATVDDQPLLAEVRGLPTGSSPAYCLTRAAVRALESSDREFGHRRRPVDRAQVAAKWARHRGRVSTTEVGSIIHVAPSNVGRILQALERDGVLLPGRDNRLGAGFFYVPA